MLFKSTSKWVSTVSTVAAVDEDVHQLRWCVIPLLASP